MSRLDELISGLCPDGVEYKELQTILKIKNGRDYKAYGEGDIPVYGSGGIIAYVDTFVYDKPTVLIPRKGSIDKLYYVEQPFWNVDTIFYTEINSELAIPRYVYHCLLREHLERLNTAGGVPSLTQKVLNQVVIPVPPLEVQREIVRILDHFTELTVELTAELTARKQQYEYYRDELIENPHGDVIECKMGDILTFLNGRAYKQEELLSEGKYPVLRVGNFYTNDSWYYSDLELDESKYCDNGDLLYSWAATLGPQIWNGEKCIFHYHIWKILFDEKEVDKEYLYYFLQYDLAKIAKSTTKSTMIHVSMGSMKERQLILPSLEEQKRIASLISKFDTLCCDIKNGLPAEITARQNQYEYYRDKLLTFKEAQ